MFHCKLAHVLPPKQPASLKTFKLTRFSRSLWQTSSMTKPKITHCFFDMDGLLLDTEEFYTKVQQKICRQYGKEFTWDLKARMMGKKALEAAQTLVRELQLEDQVTAEEFLAMREEALDQLFPTTGLMPGAERLLRHLSHHQIPICLATSCHRRHYDLKTTKHAELMSLFHHRITGDQVANGKPAPDIFLTALQQFPSPPSPDSCLVFEDAPTGVAAGKAAGMSVVMVPHAKLDRLLCREADQVLASLQDFDPAEWGLPAYTTAPRGYSGKQDQRG